ncbi:MAG: hypothetical protein B6U78_01240 [Candidatus Aenigmarchaeota archaeon ex4484_224]|nr:MAG: hypothetical protein B6U78_01240 [Candidatus Aenigmarchaeota archaeon ex4484_224]
MKSTNLSSKGLVLLITFGFFILNFVFPVLANTLTVCSSGCNYTSIQQAINNANDGDTIIVANGTYNEQIIIDKSIIIQGQGDTTIIKPNQTTADSFTLFSRKAGGSDNTAAIVVVNANATIKNLKIDGSEITSVPSSATLVGILYRGVNGTIDSVTIDNINISSGIGGNAIYVSSMGKESNVEVKGCRISNFYKNGITANYEGLTVSIHDNIVTGSGPISSVAQNGIQIGLNAEGEVKNNIVNGKGEYYTGSDWTATGILIYAANATVRGNTIMNAQTGIDVTGDYWGRFSSPWKVSIINNTVDTSNLDASQWAVGIAVATYSDGEIINANIENNQIIGGAADDAGIDIGIAYYGCPGYVIFAIKNNHIENLDYGIYIECSIGNDSTIMHNLIQNNTHGIYLCNDANATNVTVHYNNIIGNSEYSIYNNGTGELNAKYNYWGDATGPYNATTNPNGLGNGVEGNVDYSPWLGFPWPTSPMVWYVNPTGKIQEAINAASDGDTVIVVAGTYREPITVNKSLTLKGASKPIIDCSDRTVLGLSKTNGCIEVIADNVSIQGFKLIGYDPTDESWNDQKSSSYYATIKVTNGADGLKVKNNEFVAPPDGKAAVALLVDDDSDSVEFTGNTVTGYLQGVAGHKSVDNLLVKDNEFIIPIAENTSLDHDQAIGYGVQLWHGNNLRVINNTFTGSWDTVTGDYEDPDALCNHYAVSTFTTYFASAFGWPDIVGDIHIRDNEITNLYLGVGSFAGGGEIENNEIHDNLIGIQLGQVSGTWATARTAGLAITGNDIQNNKRGIWAQSFEPDGIAAHFNNIVGNTEYGIINDDPENDIFNATYNYWGHSSGPNATDNPNGLGDKVSDNVIYWPYFIDPARSSLSTESQVMLKEITEVNETKTEIIIPSNNPAANITVPSNVTNVTLNLAPILSKTSETANATLTGSLSINTSTPIGNVLVQIPSGVTISGNASWNGTINLPRFKGTIPSVPLSSLPVSPGYTPTVTSVIEIGFGDVELVFDKAVRILIPGKAGQRVGYSRGGTFTEITTICYEDSQNAGNGLPVGGDCKIDVGPDLVVWTKHFTEFVTYTESPVPPPTSAARGGAGAAIPPYLRVSITSADTAITQTANTSQSYRVKVRNLGTATGNFSLSILGLPSSWYRVSAPITLASFESGDLFYTLTLPADATNATFKVNITAVGKGGITASNSYDVTLTVLPPAIPVIINITTPVPVNVTRNVTVPANVTGVAGAITGAITMITSFASLPITQYTAGGIVGFIILVGLIRFGAKRRKPWRTSFKPSYKERVVKRLKWQIRKTLREE